jgi:hypothetical protein
MERFMSFDDIDFSQFLVTLISINNISNNKKVYFSATNIDNNSPTPNWNGCRKNHGIDYHTRDIMRIRVSGLYQISISANIRSDDTFVLQLWSGDGTENMTLYRATDPIMSNGEWCPISFTYSAFFDKENFIRCFVEGKNV